MTAIRLSLETNATGSDTLFDVWSHTAIGLKCVFLINHILGGLNSDTGNAADMKYNSKTDGLEEDRVANPIIYDWEKTFL